MRGDSNEKSGCHDEVAGLPEGKGNVLIPSPSCLAGDRETTAPSAFSKPPAQGMLPEEPLLPQTPS